MHLGPREWVIELSKLKTFTKDEVVKLASQLRFIESPSVTKDGVVKSWYQGGEPYFDLFIDYIPPNNIQWIEFTIRGLYVEWNIVGNKIKTGVTNEYERGELQPASKLLTAHEKADKDLIELTILILDSYPKEDRLIKVSAQILRTC